jgi:hypothetical protein
MYAEDEPPLAGNGVGKGWGCVFLASSFSTVFFFCLFSCFSISFCVVSFRLYFFATAPAFSPLSSLLNFSSSFYLCIPALKRSGAYMRISFLGTPALFHSSAFSTRGKIGDLRFLEALIGRCGLLQGGSFDFDSFIRPHDLFGWSRSREHVRAALSPSRR